MPVKKKSETSLKQHAKDFGGQILNRLGSVTGKWGNFYQAGAYGDLNPEAQKELLKEYRESLGLTDKTALPSGKEFQSYLSARRHSIADPAMGKYKLPGGKGLADTLDEKLRRLPDVPVGGIDVPADAALRVDIPAIQDKLNEALSLSTKDPDITALQKEYEDELALIRKAYDDVKARYHPLDLITHVSKLKIKAHDALQAQHTKEVDAIKALFQQQDFLNALDRTIPNVSHDNLQTSLISELVATHEKAIADFDKSLNEPIKKLHEAARRERARVSYLATMFYNSKAMEEKIRALHEARLRDDKIQLEVSQNGGEPSVLFKGINISDLKDVLETVTGRKIEVQADGSLRMSLPNRFFSIGYYRSSHNNVLADMRGISDALYAQGYESVTMTINNTDDQEHAVEMARIAFEACLQTGFTEDNITIEVNGKKMTANELFPDSSALAAVRNTAAKYAEQRTLEADSDAGISDAYTQEDFKKRLVEGRLSESSRPEAPAADEEEAPIRVI